MNSSPRGTADARMPRPTASSFSYFAAVSMCRYPSAMPDSTARSASSPRNGHVPSPIAGISRPEFSVTVGARAMRSAVRFGVNLSAARIASSYPYTPAPAITTRAPTR